MARLRILFLSTLLYFLFAMQPACAQKECADCSNVLVIDSLIKHYIDERAEKLPLYYNDPLWQDYCDSVIRICPNAADAYQLKALTYTKYGGYEKALSLIDSAVRYDTLGFLSYRAFIKCIFTKDYSAALADFKLADSLYKSEYVMDHSHYFFMGLCNLETNNLVAAEQDFLKDIQMAKGTDSAGTPHFNSLLYTGILYLKLNKLNKAAFYLDQCLRIYTLHPEGNFYRAKVAALQKDSIKQKLLLKKAKEAYLKNYRMNEGNIYYVNYPEQITLYEISAALGRQ